MTHFCFLISVLHSFSVLPQVVVRPGEHEQSVANEDVEYDEQCGWDEVDEHEANDEENPRLPFLSWRSGVRNAGPEKNAVGVSTQVVKKDEGSVGSSNKARKQ